MAAWNAKNKAWRYSKSFTFKRDAVAAYRRLASNGDSGASTESEPLSAGAAVNHKGKAK